MNTNLRIEHLSDHKDAIPTIVSWIYDQWHPMFPEMTLDGLAAGFADHTTPKKIPETFVVLLEDEIIGTATIVENDMETRLDLTPWLAAVYVKSEYRSQGIGSRLVQALMDEAAALGIERFYLFTPDRVSFYARLGWKILEETEYRGENVTVMYYLPGQVLGQ